MVTWERVSQTDRLEQWDLWLNEAEDQNIFQSSFWGAYKRGHGWEPVRWIARNADGAVVAMVQILTKAFPGGFRIGWAPGGPVLRFARGPAGDLPELLRGLTEALGSRQYVRLYSMVPYDGASAYAFRQACIRPGSPLNTGFSVCLDVRQPMDQLLRGMTSKHRYYVKKSLREPLHWIVGSTTKLAEDFSALYEEMTREKKLEVSQCRVDDLARLTGALGDHAMFLTGYLEDEPITSCLVLTWGAQAFYFRAASGRRGRERSAAYAMMYQLIEHLQKQGIGRFDLGGIDPRAPMAAGVNHFKLGFGGDWIEYLGEWEWASAAWLRWGVNFAVWSGRGQV
jgi:lipid II:glycine glycyltransferase (peptidoglycan interpeptide bridge formation enzyme)